MLLQHILNVGMRLYDKPQKFNYVLHLTKDIQNNIQHLIQNSFDITLIWNKFILDEKHNFG